MIPRRTLEIYSRQISKSDFETKTSTEGKVVASSRCPQREISNFHHSGRKNVPVNKKRAKSLKSFVRSFVLILTRNNESELGGPRGSNEHTAQRDRAHAHGTHATHAHERLMAVKSGVGGEAADEAKRSTPR